MNIVVKKFGGTSVATPESRERILEKVSEAINKGVSPVLVVSAMGRFPQPYATDSLLGLVSEYSEFHCKRELDMAMAVGETLSTVLLSHFLRSRGFAAEAFDAYRAGIRASDLHGDGAILQIHPEEILACVRCGAIPVIAGFQGINSQLEITTLGRGGSDTSAVAIGAALRAQVVEIYTDVDGVMTADPRVFDQAAFLNQIQFEEMSELAGEGSKVVHPRAVDLATDYSVPVWVKNTFGEKYGTFLSQVPPRQAFEKLRLVTAVAHMTGLSQVVVELEKEGVNQISLVVLEKMSQEKISLDLVNFASDRLVFITKTDPGEKIARAVLDKLGATYQIRSGCAKISMVGAGMRGAPGVAFRAHRCLHQAGVEVFHSTDSNITISCLIPAADLSKAVGAVHREFEMLD